MDLAMGSSAQSDASGGGGSQYAGRSNSLAMMLSAQLSDLLDERLSKLDHIRRYMDHKLAVQEGQVQELADQFDELDRLVLESKTKTLEGIAQLEVELKGYTDTSAVAGTIDKMHEMMEFVEDDFGSSSYPGGGGAMEKTTVALDQFSKASLNGTSHFQQVMTMIRRKLRRHFNTTASFARWFKLVDMDKSQLLEMEDFIVAIQTVNDFTDEVHSNIDGICAEKMAKVKGALRGMENIGTEECELLELFVAYDIHENNGERSGVISKDDFAKVIMEIDLGSDEFDLTGQELEFLATHFDGDDHDGKLRYEDFLQDFVGLTLQQEEIQKLFIAVDTDMSFAISITELCNFIWGWHPHTVYEEGDLVVHITENPSLQAPDEAQASVSPDGRLMLSTVRPGEDWYVQVEPDTGRHVLGLFGGFDLERWTVVATPGGAGCCQAGYPGALMHVAGGKFEPHDFSKDGAAEMLVLTIDECDNYDDRKGSSAEAICPRMASRLEVRLAVDIPTAEEAARVLNGLLPKSDETSFFFGAGNAGKSGHEPPDWEAALHQRMRNYGALGSDVESSQIGADKELQKVLVEKHTVVAGSGNVAKRIHWHFSNFTV